jgi:Tfp pilus assembly protein PilN
VDYIILVIALGMTCFAGVQLCYLMFLQATIRQQRRRIRELERELLSLRHAPEDARHDEETEETGEVWSELIDDGAG